MFLDVHFCYLFDSHFGANSCLVFERCRSVLWLPVLAIFLGQLLEESEHCDTFLLGSSTVLRCGLAKILQSFVARSYINLT